ncbi:MAG TPA: aldehyde dehydrogenase family protein, partial [Chroococcidiopsis sp.]
VALDAPIMQDEIFGPLLPVIPYDHLDEAIALINRKPKPLALYIFSRSAEVQRQVLRHTQSGGACVNEILLHLGIPDLPFGGIGASGIGAHHGKASFDTFSHYRSILFKPFWLDVPIRYAPYTDKLWILKKIFG